MLVDSEDWMKAENRQKRLLFEMFLDCLSVRFKLKNVLTRKMLLKS